MTGIYYSDLFVINGKGCLVMGSGKSDVCRNYTGSNTEMMGLDSIRLDADGARLIGYYDVTMGLIARDKSTMPSCEINYLIRMLSSQETTDNKIKVISKREFIEMSIFNIVYGVLDGKLRIKEFAQLVEKANLVCITVPWCETREEKGQLISKFIN